MNYLQAKIKVLRSSGAKVIFIKVKNYLLHTMQISTTVANGENIVCVAGSDTQISSIIELLVASNIYTSDITESEVSSLIEIAQSGNISSGYDIKSAFSVGANIGSALILALNIIFNTETRTSLSTAECVEVISELFGNVDNYCAVSMANATEIKSRIAVNLFQSVGMALMAAEYIDIYTLLKRKINISIGIDIIDTTNDIFVKTGINGASGAMLELKNTISIFANNGIKLTAGSAMSLARNAMLLDYDGDMLTTLDTQTLQQLFYIII